MIPVIVDIGIASGLLLVGIWLRANFGVFQRVLLPASVIGGFIGLFLGPNGLDLLPFSDFISKYPGVLIALVYAGLPLSSVMVSLSTMVKRSIDLWAYSSIAILVQWCGGLILSLLMLKLWWPDLHPGFGTVLPAGFVGGHGTAAAIGASFSNLGWGEATSLAMMSATVGILGSITGGIFWIKWGSEKGATGFLGRFADLPDALVTGLVNENQRSPAGHTTIAANALDTLAFHLSLIFFIFLIAYQLKGLADIAFSDFKLPLFCVAFVCGLLVRLFLSRIKVMRYVDQSTVAHFSGSFTDFLIVFGISSIYFPTVVKYAPQLSALFVVGFLLSSVTFRIIGPKVLHSNWFEKAIFTWGWITGVMAMGIALLRIVDPNNDSRVLDSFALAYLFIVPLEVGLITIAPQLLTEGHALTLIIVTGLLAIFLFALFAFRKPDVD